MFCLNCGVPLSDSDKVCPVCGQVTEAAIFQGQSDPTCTNCGAPLEEGDAFCVECGAPVRAAKDPNAPCCLHCGATIEEGAAFCVECGNPVPLPSEPMGNTVLAYAGFVDDAQPAVTAGVEPLAWAPEPEKSTLEVWEETDGDRSETPLPQIDGAVDATAVQAEALEEKVTPTGESTSKRVSISAVAAIAAIAVVVVLALLLAPKLLGSGQQEQPVSQSPAAEASSQQSGVQKGAVEVRGGVEEYSWAELSAISSEIENAEGDLEAMKIAEHYNLCDSDGKLDRTQTKRVELADGTSATVQIVGFRHDQKANGGKVGISFLFIEATESRSMNADGSSNGGWESSDLRNWLSKSFYSELPEDLKDAIVAVEKQTNNMGKTASEDSVTTTKDKLWLPSAKELCGEVGWGEDYVHEILNREGEQYLLFRNAGTDGDSDNEILSLNSIDGNSTEWWLRSTRVYEERSDAFYYVDEVGKPHVMGGEPDKRRGIIPGFCI